ncbi:aspartyl protease family protein At5g10770-like [Amaranthus tricolor]|uniref:aspartyl protease family protein At5g10770-like n=1 Tax=Amaranthus tricolor TaxID=29722 RepID=UPI002587BACB|nr:aspartyl protease family protein At5g10770-like [Amaranthus tricolor]
MASTFLIQTIKLGKCFICLSMVVVLHVCFSNSHWFVDAKDVVFKATHSELNLDLQNHFHTVEISSLLPASEDESCNASPKEKRKESSLEVRHKYGPCSTLDLDKTSRPSHVEILRHDEERVQSIRERVRPKTVEVDSFELYNVPKKDRMKQKAVGLPAMSGSTIGSGNYIVTIGLGTPKKDLSLIFDTGSDFTWTQCAPCKKSCYKQKDPIFDPTESSTYSNITCSSPLCSKVRSATSASPGCSSSTCIYGIQYGDSSFSVGFFAKDTLSLGSYNTIPNFYFGCGENNQGLFGGSAGLLGLGRNQLSFMSQCAPKYGKYFSYCLPSRSTSTGHLTFGKGGTISKTITYTPLLSSSAGPSFYFISLQGLRVGGQKLQISPTVFSQGGTLIDSGTVITRLPPDAYSALQGAFSKAMFKYPKAPALSILDTCYDLSSYPTVTVPKIGLLFNGGAEVVIPPSGIFYVKNLSQACLAFASNEDPSDVGILGNVQQLTFDVVYDVAGGKLGFGPGGCL